MRLQIHHNTRYSYSEPVFLEPHYLNFYPQSRAYIEIESFKIDVRPKPAGMAEILGAENNRQCQCWFSELISSLEVQVEMKLSTRSFNPFHFLIDTNHNTSSEYLTPYLEMEEELPDNAGKLLDSIRRDSNADLLQILDKLLAELSQNWGHDVRYEADILSVEECFRSMNGSCRDLSWMMMQMLRYVQIPSRFVSGYSFNPDLGEGHELHAWVEAYLPGAGWVGLDPSAGIFTTDIYIPVASSFHPANTMPVTGNYRGRAESTLKTKVDIVKS